MKFMRNVVKEIEALTDSAIHATRQGVEDTVEGISLLANGALDEATAALETVSSVGEATISLISSTVRPAKRRYHPLKPNIMRCACVGDTGVGKSTLLATLRGDAPNLVLPPTVYEWLYFNYCLESKRLVPEATTSPRQLPDPQPRDDEQQPQDEPPTTPEEQQPRREVVVEFLDTAGQYEGFRHLRPWHYKDVDVFLLAFDLTDRESFLNIERRWAEEITTWTPSCIKVLVGTKVDLADDDNPVSDIVGEVVGGDDDAGGRSVLTASAALAVASLAAAATAAASIASAGQLLSGKRVVSKDEAELLAQRLGAVTYVEVSSVKQLNLACLIDLCVAQVYDDEEDQTEAKSREPSTSPRETTHEEETCQLSTSSTPS